MSRLSVDTTDESIIKIRRRQRVTLVMLSGGIDSVYTLVKLLRETDDVVLAHHVDMVNEEGRWQVERAACRKIVSYCQKTYRSFEYSESGVDHRGLRFFGFDMVTVGFEAGVVAHAYHDATGALPDRWTIGSCLEEGSNSDRWVHVLACFEANCFPLPPPPFFSLPVIPKKDEMDYLGRELLELAWTCRRPVKSGTGYIECGVCKTCKLMTEITGCASPATSAAR